MISPYVIPGIRDEGTVKDKFKTIKSKIGAEPIVSLVCREFGIPIVSIKGKSRKRAIVLPRQLAMTLMYHYSNLSFKSIGQIFNKKHDMAIHSKRTIEDLMSTNKNIKSTFKGLETMVKEELLIVRVR